MTPVTAQPGMAWFELVVTDFSEHALPESTSDLGLPSPSRYTATAPGQETAIPARLSSKITFLKESPEGRRTE